MYPLAYHDLSLTEQEALNQAVALMPTYLDHDETYDFDELNPNSDKEDG